MFDSGVTFRVSGDWRLISEEDFVAAVRDGLRVKSHFGRGPLRRNEFGDIYIIRSPLDCGPICIVPAGVIDGALHIRAARPREIRHRYRPSAAAAERWSSRHGGQSGEWA